MKRNFKLKRHYKGWIALALAAAVIVAARMYSSDAYLQANEEGQEGDLSGGEVTEVQEITLVSEDTGGGGTEEETETLTEDASTGTENETGSGSGSEESIPETQEETDTEETEGETELEETEAEVPEVQEDAAGDVEDGTEEEVERSVKITSSLGSAGTVEEGKRLVLTAHLTGFDDVDYEIQWQQSEDGISWDDIDGANDTQYTVILTEDKDGYLWRASVSVSES